MIYDDVYYKSESINPDLDLFGYTYIRLTPILNNQYIPEFFNVSKKTWVTVRGTRARLSEFNLNIIYLSGLSIDSSVILDTLTLRDMDNILAQFKIMEELTDD